MSGHPGESVIVSSFSRSSCHLYPWGGYHPRDGNCPRGGDCPNDNDHSRDGGYPCRLESSVSLQPYHKGVTILGRWIPILWRWVIQMRKNLARSISVLVPLDEVLLYHTTTGNVTDFFGHTKQTNKT